MNAGLSEWDDYINERVFFLSVALQHKELPLDRTTVCMIEERKIRISKWIKWVGVLILASTILFLLWLVFFFVKNEAPFISGEILYNKEYKPGQYLDIYRPTKKVFKRSPVLFFIHGGAWVAGFKESINNNRVNGAVNALRDKGYTVISADYTLAKKGVSPFPTCILDISDALGWVRDHADTFQLDMENLGLMGESAGAHIAMMVTFPDSNETGLPKNLPKIQYVIDIYGPSDLFGIYQSRLARSLDQMASKLPQAMKSTFEISQYIFGFDPAVDSLKARTILNIYSPINYLRPGLPPVLIIHGSDDQVVPIEQSIDLHSALDSLDIQNEMQILDGVDHGFVFASGGQMQLIQDWIATFVEEHYFDHGMSLKPSHIR